MKCRYCGGYIEDQAVICPYCNSSVIDRVEKVVQEEIKAVEDSFETIYIEGEEVAERILKKERKTKIIVAILLLACVFSISFIIFGIQWVSDIIQQKNEMQLQIQNEALLVWKSENFPMLNELYEKEQFDQLLIEINEIEESEYKTGLQQWEHYLFLYHYKEYTYFVTQATWLKEIDNMIASDINMILYECILFSKQELDEFEEKEQQYMLQFQKERELFLEEMIGITEADLVGIYSEYLDTYPTYDETIQIINEYL